MPKRDARPHAEENVELELAAEKARQAVTLGRMRYVLAISVALVAILFALIYSGAL